MPTLFLDADSCPVKDESIKVATRKGWRVVAVANQYMALPRRANVELVVVTDGFDAADDRIVESVEAGDAVVTADMPLASRCVHEGAMVITPRGRLLDEVTVGEALSSRNLMESLREEGMVTGGPPPMTKRDRSLFLQRLDALLNRMSRR
jgi:uncharacterized protein